jgi:hypothetical protein
MKKEKLYSLREVIGKSAEDLTLKFKAVIDSDKIWTAEQIINKRVWPMAYVVCNWKEVKSEREG